MTDSGIGARVLRKEDKRFLTGAGNYTDDINRHGQTHIAFLRSTRAHARIKSVNTDAAKDAPGVLGVFTGADITKAGLGGLFCGWMVHFKDGSPMKTPEHPLLATDKVRYVGDHIAAVVAETYAQAREAAEQVDVDYEQLPAVVNTASANMDNAPQVHDDVPGNLCYDWEIGDQAATDAAFANAHHITTLDLINNRLIPNAMEPRAAVGEYDRANYSFTLYTTSQLPHVIRLAMSAFIKIAPEHKIRVVAPDVGGGFGSKSFLYAEETVTLWASKQIGRPIKWTAERSESFLADAHGRDHVTHAELALDADGKFTGLRVRTTANMGAYLSTFASAIPSYLYGTMLAGQYTTPAIYCEVKAVFTHTAPVDAYRGAGRPEAAFLIERLVEIAAREIGVDGAELRKRNMVPADAFPYQTPVLLKYDSGDYVQCLEKALALADYDGFEGRRADAKARGKLRGIGLSCYVEACGLAPSATAGAFGAGLGLWESAQVRFNPTGTVTVLTGSHSHGQSHETTYAQIVSDKLGVPIENIEVVHGDSDKGPFGMGTYGSRSMAVGGSAIVKATDKVVAKARKIAAHLMETAEESLVYSDGTFSAAGTNKSMTIAEIAFAAYVPHNYPEGLEPGLDETAFYDPLNFTFPFGSYVCEIEIDPDTGKTEIISFTAVDAFGTLINPTVVEGQVHGGLAQGIGQALLERCVYDEKTGQLLTGSYMDYTMPRFDDLPSYKVDTIDVPCPHNPLGVKGCGEAGAIGSPPAVINAVTDAIGVVHFDMPATPERVWRAIQDSQG